MFRIRITRYPVACLSAVTAAAILVAPGMAYAQGAGGGAEGVSALKAVTYRGYRFEVPATWPVIRLAANPGICVRFNVHAVYLGRPSANQDCPSWLLGVTQSVLIEPGPAAARKVSRENPVSDTIAARAPGIAVTATFDTGRKVIDRLLASAGLAAPSIEPPHPAVRPADAAGSAGSAVTDDASGKRAAGVLEASATREVTTQGGASSVGYPALPASVANASGLGFDTCAAPSASRMQAWLEDSPYHAVGIYIGGANRACDQQNLTASWVRQQVAAGWSLIPMYAGLQASLGQLTSPVRQGTAAAKDAVVQAQLLGLGLRTPIYYDMEAYPSAEASSALRFLSAWTTELHKLGYRSGVYGSSDSAIKNLARNYTNHKYVMPDVIYDALWNGSKSVSDRVYKAGEWTGGRRLHQYRGNIKREYGGDRIEIDQDYLDVSLPNPGGTRQAAPALTNSSGAVSAFAEGSDHQLVEESSTDSGSFSSTDLGGYLTAAPTAVQVNSSTIHVFYRGQGDVLWERTWTASGWQAPVALSQMGEVGAPRAVAQPNGVVDVFWAGPQDGELWHAQYVPDQGWSGPQELGSSLSSAPYPVETSSGQVQVFWQGTDGNLWRAVRNLASAWSAPQDLGMGDVGSAPQAVPLANGDVDVFWTGSVAPHALWSAEIPPGGAAVTAVEFSSAVVGQPWPTVTAGAERVVFRGTGGRLFSLGRVHGQWGTPVEVARGLRGAPVAATSAGGNVLQVFWTGKHGMLWTMRLTQPGGWQVPIDLGGV